jgi:large subunit ribosomal protein L22
MISKATAKYIRITPRKFRQIIPLIKGRRVEEAMWMLASVNKKASIYAREALKSALENAKKLHQGLDVSRLYVSRVIADGGPMLKRYRAASMGRANMIKKRTSHITVELDEIKAPKEKAASSVAKKRSKKKGRR